MMHDALSYLGAISLAVFTLTAVILILIKFDGPVIVYASAISTTLAMAVLFLYGGIAQPGSPDRNGFAFREGFQWTKYTIKFAALAFYLFLMLAVVFAAILVFVDEKMRIFNDDPESRSLVPYMISTPITLILAVLLMKWFLGSKLFYWLIKS